MIAFVWAESQNRVIGDNGDLPWHMPADMHRFKTLTTGHYILAGRTTYQSFGKPLPNRVNMVLTKQPASNYPESVVVFNSLDAFLAEYQTSGQDVYVVGGANVFAQLMPYVNVLYKTVIETELKGDTKMADVDYHQFQLVEQRSFAADERNQFPYRFETYRKH